MIKRWFAGDFCPRGATCSLEQGALSPSNGPKIRTMDMETRPDEPYLGTVGVFSDRMSFLKAETQPDQWKKCEGQSLPIAENQELYSILGTSYGGDGRHTFDLPNLQGQTTNANYYIYAQELPKFGR